jgi:hypothetical protein
MAIDDEDGGEERAEGYWVKRSAWLRDNNETNMGDLWVVLKGELSGKWIDMMPVPKLRNS